MPRPCPCDVSDTSTAFDVVCAFEENGSAGGASFRSVVSYAAMCVGGCCGGTCKRDVGLAVRLLVDAGLIRECMKAISDPDIQEDFATLAIGVIVDCFGSDGRPFPAATKEYVKALVKFVACDETDDDLRRVAVFALTYETRRVGGYDPVWLVDHLAPLYEKEHVAKMICALAERSDGAMAIFDKPELRDRAFRGDGSYAAEIVRRTTSHQAVRTKIWEALCEAKRARSGD